MGIEYEIDTEKRRLVAVARGEIRVSDILEALRRIYADPRFGPGFDQLCDFSDAKVSLDGGSGTGFTREISEEVWPNAELLGAGRLALVAPRPHDYGLGRMYQVALAELPLEVEVFRTVDEAGAWLTSPRPGGPAD